MAEHKFKGTDKVEIDGVDTGLTVDDLMKFAVPMPTKEETDKFFNDFVDMMERVTGEDLSAVKIKGDQDE